MHIRWTYVLPATIARWCCILKGTLLWHWRGEDYNHIQCVWMSPFFLSSMIVFLFISFPFLSFFEPFIIQLNLFFIFQIPGLFLWIYFIQYHSSTKLYLQSHSSLVSPHFPRPISTCISLSVILTGATCSSRIHEISRVTYQYTMWNGSIRFHESYLTSRKENIFVFFIMDNNIISLSLLS